MYTIVAAADFAAVCRLMSISYLVPQYHKCGAGTSYSVVSLPKIGYNVDRLRELIWSPLSALRDGRRLEVEYGDRVHRDVRFSDCTGVFEKTAAVSDWYSESSGEEDGSEQGNGSHEGDSDDHVIGMDAGGEGDGDAEDSDGGEDFEEENILDDDGHEEDSDDGCNDDERKSTIDDEEYASDEAPTNKHPRKDPGEKMSNCPSFTPCNKQDVNSQNAVRESHSGVEGRRDDKPTLGTCSLNFGLVE